LHWAAFEGKEKVVEFLLSISPKSAYSLTLDGNTPLSLAISNGHASTIEVFKNKAPLDSVLDAFTKERGEYLVQAKGMLEKCAEHIVVVLPIDIAWEISEYIIDSKVVELASLSQFQYIAAPSSAAREEALSTNAVQEEPQVSDHQPVFHLGDCGESE
jgi:hypothetical protein